VYLLGDLCYRISPQEANTLLKRLHGRKILLLGNHDKHYCASLFVEILAFKYLKLDGGIRFALMHYPLMEWPSFHHGSYQVHGHIHEKMGYNLRNRDKGIRRYEVGVDANNFYPVALE
ncbi:hypothetical protein, partial [Enterobacter bugandensis]|uniref:hypothetical protein n=1 Tax=Enterobacter bugandensis TaxID=881260 RepID=UPI0021CEB7DE